MLLTLISLASASCPDAQSLINTYAQSCHEFALKLQCDHCMKNQCLNVLLKQVTKAVVEGEKLEEARKKVFEQILKIRQATDLKKRKEILNDCNDDNLDVRRIPLFSGILKPFMDFAINPDGLTEEVKEELLKNMKDNDIEFNLLKEMVGEGSSGQVFRLEEPYRDRNWIIKKPKKSSLSGIELKEMKLHQRFYKIDPFHIPAAYPDHVSFEGEKVMVMEDGGMSFDEAIKKQILNDEMKTKIVQELVNALKKFHDSGLYHSDIKPANLTYDDKTERIRFIDFGKSMDLAGEDYSRKNFATWGAGTRLYGPQTTDFKTFQQMDFFALMMSLFQMCANLDTDDWIRAIVGFRTELHYFVEKTCELQNKSLYDFIEESIREEVLSPEDYRKLTYIWGKKLKRQFREIAEIESRLDLDDELWKENEEKLMQKFETVIQILEDWEEKVNKKREKIDETNSKMAYYGVHCPGRDALCSGMEQNLQKLKDLEENFETVKGQWETVKGKLEAAKARIREEEEKAAKAREEEEAVAKTLQDEEKKAEKETAAKAREEENQRKKKQRKQRKKKQGKREKKKKNQRKQ